MGFGSLLGALGGAVSKLTHKDKAAKAAHDEEDASGDGDASAAPAGGQRPEATTLTTTEAPLAAVTPTEVEETPEAVPAVSAVPKYVAPKVTASTSWADFDEPMDGEPPASFSREARDEKLRAEIEERLRVEAEEKLAQERAKKEAESVVFAAEGIDDMLRELPEDDDASEDEVAESAAATAAAPEAPKVLQRVETKKERAKREEEEFANALAELGVQTKEDEAAAKAKAEARRKKKAAAKAKAEAGEAKSEAASEEPAKEEDVSSEPVELVDPAEAKKRLMAAKAAKAAGKKKMTGAAAVVAAAQQKSKKKSSGSKDRKTFNELPS